MANIFGIKSIRWLTPEESKTYKTAYKEAKQTNLKQSQWYNAKKANKTASEALGSYGRNSYTVGEKNKYNTQSINDSNVVSNILKDLGLGGDSGSGSYSGGGYAAKIDINPMIKALREGAANQKKTISDTYKAERDEIARTLAQYKEENAKNKQTQLDAFNSARADLEEEAYMNNRAAQQSAAARGIGGSGLQQLAQLQSQIQSAKDVSSVAKENTTALDKLATALRQAEDNATSSTNKLTTEERNALNSVDSETAKAIEELQYNEEVRYQNALAEAAARSASASNAAKAQAAEYAATFGDLINTLKTDANDKLDKGIIAINKVIKNKTNYNSGKEYESALKSAYNKYAKGIKSTIKEAGLGDYGEQYKQYYLTQLQNAYNKGAGYDQLVYKLPGGTGGNIFKK